MLFHSCSSMVLITMLGYSLAQVLRCFRAVKTIIAESCDATNQAKAMGYMTAGWGVGTIAGPTVGGLLANPCGSFASGLSVCEPGSWLRDRYAALQKQQRVSKQAVQSFKPEFTCTAFRVCL